MYSRDFGGIKSEGQLYNLEREYNEARAQEPQEAEAVCQIESEPKKSSPLSFLQNLQLDDLILIGIGLLLLLDSQEENDIFVLLIAFLLFFN